MASFINRNSYAILAILALLTAACFLLQDRVSLWRVALIIALVIVVSGVNLLLRRQATAVGSLAGVERALRAGRPTLVEFYSDY